MYFWLFAVRIVGILILIAGRGTGRGALRTGGRLGRKLLVDFKKAVGHEDKEHGELKEDANHKGTNQHYRKTDGEAAFCKQHEKADGDAENGDKNVEETVDLLDQKAFEGKNVVKLIKELVHALNALLGDDENVGTDNSGNTDYDTEDQTCDHGDSLQFQINVSIIRQKFLKINTKMLNITSFAGKWTKNGKEKDFRMNCIRKSSENVGLSAAARF